MGIASGVKKVDIPGEPGQWAVIKKLPWGVLEGARKAQARAFFAAVKDMPPDFLSQQVTKEQEAAAREQIAADPATKYDAEFMLRHAIAEWSYEAALPDGVMLLEPATKQFLFLESVAFNEPGRTEAEALDATPPSTSP